MDSDHCSLQQKPAEAQNTRDPEPGFLFEAGSQVPAPVYFEQGNRLLKMRNLILTLPCTIKTIFSTNLSITCHQIVEIKFTLTRGRCATVACFLKTHFVGFQSLNIPSKWKKLERNFFPISFSFKIKPRNAFKNISKVPNVKIRFGLCCRWKFASYTLYQFTSLS